MTTIDVVAGHHRVRRAVPAQLHASAAERPLVPVDTIPGRSLIAIVAIMSFMACLTLGAVVLIRTAASDWQSAATREVTIQIRPLTDRNIEADLAKAAELAQAVPGVQSVHPYTREESSRLLEPWLGTGLALDDLPVPRLVVVRLADHQTADFSVLRARLAEQIPGATLDDHREWIARMKGTARAAVLMALGVLGLMLAATIISVAFATRAALATNRAIVEVLHFVGAADRFVASEFQHHFSVMGFKGGALGAGMAVLFFGFTAATQNWLISGDGPSQIATLFGSFAVGPSGYAAMAGLAILIGAVAALTSRLSVQRTLSVLDR